LTSLRSPFGLPTAVCLAALGSLRPKRFRPSAFFKYVIGKEDPVFNVKLRRTGARVPVVLSKSETQRVLEKLDNPASSVKAGEAAQEQGTRYGLAARLQYGAGLRLSELVRLRIKDVDLERGTITVRIGKGNKDCLGRRLTAPSPFGLPAAGCLAA
jgi:integrase